MIELTSEGIKREDRRTGLLLAVMRRMMGDKKAEVWDFFPEHLTVEHAESEESRARAQLAKTRAGLRALAAMSKGSK